jgi:hypothetical protein
MSKPKTKPSIPNRTPKEESGPDSVTTFAALLYFAEKFPHRQFNSLELSVLSGLGRTALSQIKNAPDTPFSMGKCSLKRLDAWLANHPAFKQN